MLHFLVFAARHGRPVSPNVIAFATSPVSPTMTEAAANIYWSSDQEQVHFAAWHDGDEPTPWLLRDGCLLAHAGEALLIDRPTSSPTGVLERIAETPPSTLVDGLEGIYALVRIDADGFTEIATDPLGIHTIYTAETAALTIFSNHPELVAAAVEADTGRMPGPYLPPLASVVACGYTVGDHTAFEGIDTIPFGSGVAIAANGAISVPQTRPHPWETERCQQVTESTLDEIEARMIAAMKAAITRYPSDPLAELTAGWDSRLVLAIAARAGLLADLTFYTRGSEASVDFQVAAEIAERVGLTFERTIWPTPAGSWTTHLERHVLRTSGQLGSWESSESRHQRGATFSGLLGETLRSGFPKLRGPTLRKARQQFRQLGRDRAGPIRPEILDPTIEAMAAVFEAPSQADHPPDQLGQIFFVKERQRRWLGPQMERHIRHFYPCYVTGGPSLAFQVGAQGRQNGEIHRALMQRAGLGIDDIPFGKADRKVVQSSEFHPGAHRIRRLNRPSAMDGALQDLLSSRGTRDDAIRDLLADGRSEAAFAIVDRAEFEANLRNYDSLRTIDKIRLHWAVTPLLWLRRWS